MNIEITSQKIEQICGLKANTLHYYIQSGAIVPDIDKGSGRGTKRLFSSTNLIEAIIIQRLIDLGLSKKRIVQALKSIQNANERSKLSDPIEMSKFSEFLVLSPTADGSMTHQFIENNDPDALMKILENSSTNTMFDCSIVLKLPLIWTEYDILSNKYDSLEGKSV